MVPVCCGALAAAGSDAASAPSGWASKWANLPPDLGGRKRRQRVDLPRAGTCPPGHREARDCAQRRDLSWAGSVGRRGQGGPAGFGPGFGNRQEQAVPASPARPLQARRPGWRRVERSRRAWGPSAAGRARPARRGQIRWAHI